MTTKKQEQSYKREANWCLALSVVGYFMLGILEPIVLWRSAHVMNHTKDAGTRTVATWATVLSGIATSILVLSLIIVVSSL